MPTRRFQELANVPYFLGVLVGLALAIAAAWADFEGLSYFATGAGYQPFNGLHCPVLMSHAETASVSVSFDNPTNQDLQPYYDVEISGHAASRSLEGQVAVPPHAERRVVWTVTAQDIDLGNFVFVKTDILPTPGYSTREATCGILVIDLAGLTGTPLLYLVVMLSAAGMIAGLVLPALGLPADQAAQYDNEASTDLRRGSQAVGISTTIAMLTGLLGWWLGATIFCAISILLLVILLRPTAW